MVKCRSFDRSSSIKGHFMIIYVDAEKHNIVNSSPFGIYELNFFFTSPFVGRLFTSHDFLCSPPLHDNAKSETQASDNH